MRQVLISMRLPRETVEYFKAHYEEYTGGMREVLVKEASKAKLKRGKRDEANRDAARYV